MSGPETDRGHVSVEPAGAALACVPASSDELVAVGGEMEEQAVVIRKERELAVAHWLLGAAEDRNRTRKDWEEQGIALLACGVILSAVRIPARLVWAAAKTDELWEVDAFLRRFFDGGAVFMDIHAHQYYALVPGTSEWRWSGREFPGADCLGRDSYLGVPKVGLTEPGGRSYWCVSMDSAGDLCYLDEVEDLVRVGRVARSERVVQ